jgi:hypothetical protein
MFAFPGVARRNVTLYLGTSEGVIVLPSCYIPHSNKLPFAIIEVIVSSMMWLHALACFVSFGVVILTFMKPTINTLVSTNRRSPWLVQLKKPLEFKSNICPKGNVTLIYPKGWSVCPYAWDAGPRETNYRSPRNTPYSSNWRIIIERSFWSVLS